MPCYLISVTRVAVVYICPLEKFGPEHSMYASRFAQSYIHNPSTHPHDLYVVSNGGPPSDQTRTVFDSQSAKYIIHDGSGKDIGAYQFAAANVPCDLMIFIGGSTFIRGKNWVNRAVEVFHKYGDGIYGTMANTGDQRFDVWPHIRTTGFWMPPIVMNAYPDRIKTDDKRYPFEHGPNCITQWCRNQRLKAMIVTWDGEYDQDQWGGIPNGFHQGDQSGLVFGDRLCEPPYWPA